MKKLWKQVDALLRGREAFSSEEALAQVQTSQLVVMVILLAAVYGAFMGVYAIFSRGMCPNTGSCFPASGRCRRCIY